MKSPTLSLIILCLGIQLHFFDQSSVEFLKALIEIKVYAAIRPDVAPAPHILISPFDKYKMSCHLARACPSQFSSRDN